MHGASLLASPLVMYLSLISDLSAQDLRVILIRRGYINHAMYR
jgi:hypothetical protein